MDSSDLVAQGSGLGKMAIQADGAGDYKQAYFFYQECLKNYIDALRTEQQEDRLAWTEEQILIRFERLAELNAWYKRKNMLEPDWLELEDLRDRLESAAPKIQTRLRKIQYDVPQQQQPSQGAVPSQQTNGTGPAGGPGQGFQPPTTTQSPPPNQKGGYQSPAGSTTSSVPTNQYANTQQAYQAPPSQQGGIPPPPQGEQTYNVPGAGGRRTSTSYAGPNGQVTPTQQNYLPNQQPTANGIQSPYQQPTTNIPPNQNQYNQNPYDQGRNSVSYNQQQVAPSGQYSTSPDPTPLGRVATGLAGYPSSPPVQQQIQAPVPQPDTRTYLLTPFLRLNLPVKMYHCYGAAQRYRGGAEGWNIEIKDGSKNPIYYLYGLKQANAPLIEMSLHREDGKKTRCMDIYTPLKENRQVYQQGDMTYKHYLPVPVDVYCQGEQLPTGQRRRIFTFNGRRFIWKQDGQPSNNNNLVNESLYEVDDGPNGLRQAPINSILGDGRPLDTKIAWYEHTGARKKLGRINVVAGLELSVEEIFLGTILGHVCTAWEATRKGL